MHFGANARDPLAGLRLAPDMENPLSPGGQSGLVASAKKRGRYCGIATVK
jgi:hypothetical protein